MKKPGILLTGLGILLFINSFAQIDLTYQKPPKEILDLADVNLPPQFILNDKGDNAILAYRNQYRSIAELSEVEMKLAGLRINPVTNISSRERYYTGLALLRENDSREVQIKDLPSDARISNLSWSPDQNYMAFTNTTAKGVELWIVDIQNATAKRITDDNLNANLGRPFVWFQDSKNILGPHTKPSCKY